MPAYAININRDVCVGDGLCQEIAPRTFGIAKDGKSIVLDANGDESTYVKEAAKACRLRAISLVDPETGRLVWPRS